MCQLKIFCAEMDLLNKIFPLVEWSWLHGWTCSQVLYTAMGRVPVQFKGFERSLCVFEPVIKSSDTLVYRC